MKIEQKLYKGASYLRICLYVWIYTYTLLYVVILISDCIHSKVIELNREILSFVGRDNISIKIVLWFECIRGKTGNEINFTHVCLIYSYKCL